MTSRGFVITTNNPTVFIYNEVKKFINSPSIRYGICQAEKGKEGTLHLQWYVEAASPHRVAWLRGLFPKSHVEVRRGSTKEAWDYCNKSDTKMDCAQMPAFSKGEPPTGPGARSDLITIGNLIVHGASPRDIALEFPAAFIRYHRGIQSLWNVMLPPRDSSVPHTVVIYYGKTGSGKSRLVGEAYPGAYWIPIQQNKSIWFDGYMGQKEIVWDEFGGECVLNTLLRICDRHQVKVPNKGGYMELQSTTTVFTSNSAWEEWYDWDGREEKKLAFKRRIGRVHHFDGL